MLAMIATFRIHEGRGAEFERLFVDLASEIQKNELNTFMYRIWRARSDANVYKLVELYANQEAFDAHMASPWLKAAGPAIRPLLDGPPILEPFDPVV